MIKTLFSISAGPDFTPMQTVRPEAVAGNVNISGAEAWVSDAFEADELLILYANGDALFSVGPDADELSGGLPPSPFILPGGAWHFVAVKAGDFLSAIRYGADDTLLWVAKATS
jgi:hypothetical protein